MSFFIICPPLCFYSTNLNHNHILVYVNQKILEKKSFYANLYIPMADYKPYEIEPKWQKYWEENKIYNTKDIIDKPKFYILDMFPYPSGSGIHVGHCKGYVASDVIARKKMMQGYNVLHPMGWDAFGLPAENFAIKNNIHPKIAVKQNIDNFKKQIKEVGFTYDWDREINTTDPDYYKWTQWAFLKMFEMGLVEEIYEPVNWCPSCKTVLANEDTEQGKCERCSTEIQRKPIREWSIKMTEYADRLLKDLKDLDWEKSIIDQQINWIGRSNGAEIDFKIGEYSFSIFTTRLDTIFGCTYCVLAPEHPLLEKLDYKNKKEVLEYIEQAKKKSDLERTELAKEKTGIKLEGIKAINPYNQQEIDIYIGDYVLGHYGTGAIMAVPAHDKRDFEFAKKHNIEIIEVVEGGEELPYIEDGILTNSEGFDGLTSDNAREKMEEYAKSNDFGKDKINYKMRDWVFARQRYWGEPIPLVFCEHCKKEIEKGNTKGYSKGEIINPGWIIDNNLPLKLPEIVDYKPTETGEPPLANAKDWVNIECPKCKGEARRETNTMPQWAGSCWYYLRYIDPNNKDQLVDIDKERHWLPVDIYIGGAEHATRHLLYARYWHKFLYDIGAVSTSEPFKKLQHVGLILGEDGQKMSKRWGNVINPSDVVKEYGADTLRTYEMFMGPFAESCVWNKNGLIGIKRFLDRVYNLKIGEDTKEIETLLHKTIKKVTQDIDEFKFNTAISAMMIFVNTVEKEGISKESYIKFIQLLSPFAPHLAEEIYNKDSIFNSKWPEYDENKIKEDKIQMIIQVNGKLRDSILMAVDLDQDSAVSIAKESEKIIKWLDKDIKKIIFVKNKLINFVICVE